MRRFAEKTVFFGLVTAWRFAAWPTSTSPVFVKATTEGVVRAPSELAMTTASPASRMAIQELVVPRSIPMILLIVIFLGLSYYGRACAKDKWPINGRF